MSTSLHVTSASGVLMPRIIYGTAWKGDQTEQWVTAALKLGFRGIDTAGQPKHYQEAGVGAGIAAALGEGLQREELYVQTKFTPVAGQDPTHMPYDPQAPLAEQVAQSFATSQQNLQTDYVDTLVLHSPLSPTRNLAQVWRAMEAIVDQGGARQLGISNCYSPELLEGLYRATRIKPVVVQNRFYAETGYDREVRAFCEQEGIIYQSFWTLTANPHLLRHPEVGDLAQQYGRTPAQILFRYLTQQGIVPLTGTTSEEHLREDLEIFEFELNDDECAAITTLLTAT